MKLTHRSTMIACYNGYVTQAICINLAPLLFLTFQRQFSISLSQIGLLVTFNFLTQLTVDVLATRYADRLNLRFCAVFAHVVTAAGLCGLAIFTLIMPPYAGLLLAVSLLGIGGGFTEVIISPLMEACPTDGKSGNMSLLHSFYCWGQAGVVMLSGAFFAIFDIDQHWRTLPFLWAIIPMIGAIAFCVVPIYYLPRGEEKGTGILALLNSRSFRFFLLMMFCAGASEMVMSQWASGFVESALGISKELGDLFGPGMFAIMMGVARLYYGAFSSCLDLRKLMMLSCLICVAAYLLAALAPNSVLSLIGCGLCGLSVGIFWPGTLSQAAEKIPTGGIAMFAMLAIFGDLGCLSAPAISGVIADMFGGDLRMAFLFAILFPAVSLVALLILKHRSGEKGEMKK